MRLLLVEDNEQLAHWLTRTLTDDGFLLDHVGDGEAAEDALRASSYDVVLLDLNLPRMSGKALLRRMRSRGDATPVLILTATGAIDEKVVCLGAGADDYIVKPFGFEELTARMRAVLRRSGGETGELVHGPLRIDLPSRRLQVSGEPVALTAKEFDILVCLALEPGRVVSRDEIFDRVWDEHWYGPRKVLDVHMAALRRKLGDPNLIETVYGRGFRLAEPPGGGTARR